MGSTGHVVFTQKIINNLHYWTMVRLALSYIYIYIYSGRVVRMAVLDYCPSGTCAKAVCSCLSWRQHGVGCQVQPCGCDCPSQLRKIPFSIFQTLKTIENFMNVHLSSN